MNTHETILVLLLGVSMLLNMVQTLLRVNQLPIATPGPSDEHSGSKKKKRDSNSSDSHCSYSDSGDGDFSHFSLNSKHCMTN